MSFKIIAIKPLGGCKSRFLKNLKRNHIYKFYNDYTFEIKGTVVKSIKYSSEIPDDFFYVDRIVQIDAIEKKNKPIKINACAVVGKNGSGKSAISELFIASLFIISKKLGYVQQDKFLDPEDKDNVEDIQRYNEDLPQVETGIAVEIYYHLDNEIYKLRILGSEISFTVISEIKGNFKFAGRMKKVNDKNDLPPFFYSMVINYSFYGFNSNQIGMWIRAFFHKNDGYQMPIVINPYRDKGIMNINTENVLTRARVLANILSIKDYKDINSKSKISDVELYFNIKKDHRFLKDGSQRFSDDFILKFRNKLLSPLYIMTFNDEYVYPEIDTEIKRYAEIYLIHKLTTIPTRYSIFQDYNKRARKKESTDNYIFNDKNAKRYVQELYEDKSHITLKVKQTINFLRENIFNFNDKDLRVKLDVGSIEKAMETNLEKLWFTEIIDYLPPPFLISKIRFEDKSDFETLSSGEKQKIYSLNSIIYHLKNIDSVHKNEHKNQEKSIVVYETINLLFDEIELYYHPDFQKTILSDLLKFIKIADYKYINNINMIFLTHSPFILSDIPNPNILYLELGNSIEGTDRPKKSFGANISELLAHSFFIADGLLGDYAKNKIEITLNWLKIKANDWHKIKSNINDDQSMKFEIDQSLILKFDTPAEEYRYHKQVINMIDEPLVRTKLKAMYIDFVKDDSYYLDEELLKAEERVLELKRKKGI